MRILMCLLAILLLTGCGSPDLGKIVGVYRFRSDKLQETLELKDGGAFTQQINIEGRIFTAEGDWAFEKPKAIIFRGAFLERADTISGKVVDVDPPKEYSTYKGYWHANTRKIEFDDIGKYFVKKMDAER